MSLLLVQLFQWPRYMINSVCHLSHGIMVFIIKRNFIAINQLLSRRVSAPTYIFHGSGHIRSLLNHKTPPQLRPFLLNWWSTIFENSLQLLDIPFIQLALPHLK